MASQPGRPGRLRQESLRMKIEGVFPSKLDFRARDQIRVPNLDQAVSRNKVGFLQQEKENRIGYLDLIAVFQKALFYGDAVDKRAISTVEIRDSETLSLSVKQTMTSRHRQVGHANQVRGFPPQRDRCFVQLEYLTLQRSSNSYQPRGHRDFDPSSIGVPKYRRKASPFFTICSLTR